MSFDLGFGFGLGLRCWTLPWRVHLSLFRCLLRCCVAAFAGVWARDARGGLHLQSECYEMSTAKRAAVFLWCFLPWRAVWFRPLCGRATSVKNTQLLNSLAENLIHNGRTRFSAREFNKRPGGETKL